MRKINEGDVIEGIFAIACGLFIVDGKINKIKLNEYRKKIEPSNFSYGKVDLDITSDQKIGIDFLTVNLSIRLKTKNVRGAFGDDFGFYVSKQSDIGDLDRKIDTLISTSARPTFLNSLRKAKEDYLKNNKAEKIRFIVEADGMEGEKSAGTIKGDVEIRLSVLDIDTNSRQTLSTKILSYSLKSGSSTVSNLSPYRGGLSLVKFFGLPDKNIQKYERALGGKTQTPQEKINKSEAIDRFFSDISKSFVANSVRTNFTDKAFEYIRKEVFGADQAELIAVNKNAIKQISNKEFDDLYKRLKENKEKIIVTRGTGDKTIYFVSSKNKRSILFKIRIKREKGLYNKLLVEMGNML